MQISGEMNTFIIIKVSKGKNVSFSSVVSLIQLGPGRTRANFVYLSDNLSTLTAK